MKTIHKFKIDTNSGKRHQINGFPLPRGARILNVQGQGGDIAIWAEVETMAPIEVREFIINGTGQEMHPYSGTYLGTVQVGFYVWHVYESNYQDRKVAA